jgi:hypothetical protein
MQVGYPKMLGFINHLNQNIYGFGGFESLQSGNGNG